MSVSQVPAVIDKVALLAKNTPLLCTSLTLNDVTIFNQIKSLFGIGGWRFYLYLCKRDDETGVFMEELKQRIIKDGKAMAEGGVCCWAHF